MFENEMNRCVSTDRLEVHHKRRDGGNDLNNTQVLCHDCHVNTITYGKEGKSPPEFSEEIKKAAKKRSGFRCECRKDNCHISEKMLNEAVINASKLC